jgi:hypothetical protein
MIYKLAFFHHAEGEPQSKLIFDEAQNKFVPWFRTCVPSFGGNLAISIVEMLGAMSKGIRAEARSAWKPSSHSRAASSAVQAIITPWLTIPSRGGT